jgi:hypothetical protein
MSESTSTVRKDAEFTSSSLHNLVTMQEIPDYKDASPVKFLNVL